MNKSKVSILLLCLCLSLTQAKLAFAECEDKENLKSLLARVGTSLRPIGTVESMGILKIDGRIAKGQELLWGNELLQAPENASARVSLPSLGQISLNPDSSVRIATLAPSANLQSNRQMLRAALIKGSVNVRLQSNVTAYLSYAQSSFVASEGAIFTFEVREEQAILHTRSGNVASLGQWTLDIPLPVLLAAERSERQQKQTQVQKYIIKPYPEARIPITEIRARSSRQIQVRVTDENDNPVPDMTVVFSLKEVIGQLSANAVTNSQGIATATFSANSLPGSFSAYTVSLSTGEALSMTGSINIISAGFWTMATALPVLATVAAAATAGATIAVTQDKKQPVSQALPPPVIKP